MTTIDDSKVMATLTKMERSLTSQEHKRAFNRAARKGGNILKSEVRNSINNTGTFEHIGMIKRSVKVVNTKSRRQAGVNVFIKGPDVPVGTGKHRRFWKLSSYSKLVFKGNYKSPGRKTKSGSNRGNVKGTNPNNIFDNVKKSHGGKALEVVKSAMVMEVRKEIAKSVVR